MTKAKQLQIPAHLKANHFYLLSLDDRLFGHFKSKEEAYAYRTDVAVKEAIYLDCYELFFVDRLVAKYASQYGVITNMTKRKEHTKRQSQAVRRNFALMNLAGMQSQIYMVYNCLTQERCRVQASIKLNAIHKHLEEIKEIVKKDYAQLITTEKQTAVITSMKGGT